MKFCMCSIPLQHRDADPLNGHVEFRRFDGSAGYASCAKVSGEESAPSYLP